jgi:hypothetical protein
MGILKNIFVTSGITFIFGMYSIYHLYIYMKKIDNKINNINNINKRDLNYNQLEIELIKINNNIEILSDRIDELESKKNTIWNEDDDLLNEISLNDVRELTFNNNLTDEKLTEIKKIGDYTCISMEEIANEEKENEKDSDEESIRSRSSSLNWVKKTIFG